MNLQVKLAIISIIIVIPLSSYTVWATDSASLIESDSNSQLQVITSFYPLYEFSENISQNKADVILLVPPGVEPHDWEPTIQDVQLMQNSDLIVINGIGFEDWIHDLEELNFQGTIVDTSKGIITKHNENFGQTDHDHKENDPHIWLNPQMAKTQVKNIANAFSKADPVNSEFYQKNAIKYIEELDFLDSKIKNELSQCNSDFIAFHNAFSYFAEEYGLTQHTIVSSSPNSEATAKTIENVITTATNLDTKIIFTEEMTDTRTSQIIADEIGGKVLILSPIEVQTDGNYISRMTDNLENLKEALC